MKVSPILDMNPDIKMIDMEKKFEYFCDYDIKNK